MTHTKSMCHFVISHYTKSICFVSFCDEKNLKKNLPKNKAIVIYFAYDFYRKKYNISAFCKPYVIRYGISNFDKTYEIWI